MAVLGKFAAFAGGAWLVIAAPAFAQQSLTLPEAQHLALQRSQQLVAADAALAATAESAVAAGQLPDPVLRAGVDNVPLSGPDRFSLSADSMTMRRIGLMQELTRGEKRQLRVERVERDRDRLRAEREQTIAQIEREAALAWIDRRYGQAMVQLVQQQLREARLQVEGAELAFRTGRGSQADVFAARAAVANMDDRLRQAERQLQGAGLMLARWVGADRAAQPVFGDVPWQQPPAAAKLLGRLQDLPAMRVLQAQVGAAQTEVRQAEANAKPDVSVEAMYQKRGPAFPDMFSIGVSIPLPIARANRQDREVAAKLAMLAEARGRYDDALAAQEGALGIQLNDWEAGRQRLAGLRSDLLPAAHNRTEGALTGYRSGKGDLAAVLSARRDELDAQVQVLQVEMETARQWAQLEFVVPHDAR